MSGIVCFSFNHLKWISFVKLYLSLRSSQVFKLPYSKSWGEKLIFLTADFVKYTGLPSIWVYLLNHKNCERKQAGVSGYQEKCAFQLMKISLWNGRSFLSDVFFLKKILE